MTSFLLLFFLLASGASAPAVISEVPEGVAQLVVEKGHFIQPMPEAADTVPSAHLDLVVEATGATATGAVSDARFRIRTVIGALERSGAEIREITIDEPQVSPIFERRVASTGRRPPPPPRLRGYEAWASITIVTPTVARVGALIDGITGAGGYVQGMRFETVPEQPPSTSSSPPSRHGLPTTRAH